MMHILSEKNNLCNQFIAELRDIHIQNDRSRFRRNMKRIGEIFAYEISKSLQYEKKDIETPLGKKEMHLISNKIVNATILRAGLPLHDGILSYYDQAENAFISAYREYQNEYAFDIKFEHVSGPSIEEKTLILSDPMLASGASMIGSYQALMKHGKPRHTHIVAIIASEPGVEKLQKELMDDTMTLWIGDIDPSLNAKSYIVPGIGDAGDLAFGEKN